MMGWGMEAGNTDIGFMVVRQEESHCPTILRAPYNSMGLGMTE
jgi:hypothetical protein